MRLCKNIEGRNYSVYASAGLKDSRRIPFAIILMPIALQQGKIHLTARGG